jgi:hypothetical protein
MELTESKWAEFFPLNNRFIYYCAKRYGYTFRNDEVVNDARYYSVINLMRYVENNGSVFKDEPEMISIVMSCIRYGILHAYSQKERGKKQVESRPFSDFITDSNWGSNSDSEYNTITNHMPKEYQEETHFKTLLEILVEHRLSELEKSVLQECILEGKSHKAFSVEHEVAESVIQSARRKIKRKFKNLIKKEDEQVSNYQEHVPSVERAVRGNNRNQSELENEEKEYRYLKAMSFLHS